MMHEYKEIKEVLLTEEQIRARVNEMGVQQGTQKAELVSTLSIAGSIITNVVVTTIAAIGGAALFSLFPPVIIEAFTYVAPAIFGAMFSMNAVRHPKLGAFAIALVLFMILVIRVLPSYVIILVAVFGTVAFDLLTEKKGKQN
jgi:predicted branched-subunit amino acid permease